MGFKKKVKKASPVTDWLAKKREEEFFETLEKKMGKNGRKEYEKEFKRLKEKHGIKK